MGANYEALLAHLADIQNLDDAASVLSWDQETVMPEGGTQARAHQIATLSRIRHEMLISDKTPYLIEAASEEIDLNDYASDGVSMLRIAQSDYELAAKLPAKFVADQDLTYALAHEVWAKARAQNDFSIFEDTLKRIMDMARQEAAYRGYNEHPYDALLNKYERGMTASQVHSIFEAHRPALVDLIARISAAPQVDDSCLHLHFDIEKQKEFGLKTVQAFGFDFKRGIQAISVHPFCTNFSKNDVRMTTRFEENFLNPALFGLMHEAGHGMYEQGSADSLEGTILRGGTSLGVHESQSRMWENIVGRSKGFWSWALPQLKETFPQLKNVSLDEFFKAVNKVSPSYVRVEADEATYNLHIILRFEIEKDLLSGELAVKDLPEVWRTRFTEYLGVTPPNDALGVLQDVHWSLGLIGYFPTYALGNLLSVQYYNQALKDCPTIPSDIANGKFDTLLTWLNQNIHQYGRKFTGAELTRQITGGDISPDAYVAYLNEKYSAVYGL